MMQNVSVKPVQKSAGYVLHAFTGVGNGTCWNICQQIDVFSEKANGMTSKCHINLLYLRKFVT
jgi:hypothetical protein